MHHLGQVWVNTQIFPRNYKLQENLFWTLCRWGTSQSRTFEFPSIDSKDVHARIVRWEWSLLKVRGGLKTYRINSFNNASFLSWCEVLPTRVVVVRESGSAYWCDVGSSRAVCSVDVYCVYTVCIHHDKKRRNAKRIHTIRLQSITYFQQALLQLLHSAV